MNGKPAKKLAKKKPARKKKNWGLLLFMAADNNLSNAGLKDIRELCSEGAASNVHVGVEIDTRGDHTGSIRYEITEPDERKKAYRIVIDRLSERNSGDPRVLKSFLDWGTDRYPAEHRVVVIWSHGTGFRSIRRDVGVDDFGGSMDMPEIEGAFRSAGVTADNKIGVLGFDACLMNMIEVAHHFKDQVEVIVGSQQTEPGDGWPYHKILRNLKASNTPREVGKKIVRSYVQDYRRRGTHNVTQSAIDLSKIDDAMGSLSVFGKALSRSLKKDRNTIGKIRLRCQSFKMNDYIDIIHFTNMVSKSIRTPEVSKAAKAARSATKSCIIASGCYGRRVRNANGLSFWFPPQKNLFHRYRNKYHSLNFSKKHSGWASFLDEFFG
ncbi:MAG: hypothetical protein GY847_00470 [Proteobacteria bacterium]|nr:hypothetical protein [Pseudomonadota bacterium]